MIEYQQLSEAERAEKERILSQKLQETHQTRLLNIRKLLFNSDMNNKEISELIGISSTYFSRWKKQDGNDSRRISEESARRIEVFLGLEDYYLDFAHGLDEKPSTPVNTEDLVLEYQERINELEERLRKQEIAITTAYMFNELDDDDGDIVMNLVTSMIEKSKQRKKHPAEELSLDEPELNFIKLTRADGKKGTKRKIS